MLSNNDERHRVSYEEQQMRVQNQQQYLTQRAMEDQMNRSGVPVNDMDSRNPQAYPGSMGSAGRMGRPPPNMRNISANRR